MSLITGEVGLVISTIANPDDVFVFAKSPMPTNNEFPFCSMVDTSKLLKFAILQLSTGLIMEGLDIYHRFLNLIPYL